jgi:hypothetical protein
MTKRVTLTVRMSPEGKSGGWSLSLGRLTEETSHARD